MRKHIKSFVYEFLIPFAMYAGCILFCLGIASGYWFISEYPNATTIVADKLLAD